MSLCKSLKMVQLWVSLQNNRISGPCMNRRVTRIFLDEYVFFYGDYDLDIYIGTKHDYRSLDDVVHKVRDKCTGWIRYCHERESVVQKSLKDVIGECGNLTHKSLPKVFPRRESVWDTVQCEIYRDDGNFKMFACETERFYYVICFATS